MMTRSQLERCLCKNSNGTYNIYEAIRYLSYSKSPEIEWTRIKLDIPELPGNLQFYFFTNEPATDRQGIDLLMRYLVQEQVKLGDLLDSEREIFFLGDLLRSGLI